MTNSGFPVYEFPILKVLILKFVHIVLVFYCKLISWRAKIE